MSTGPCSWVPALRPLLRASAGTTIAWVVRETDLRLQETIAGSGPLFRIVIYNEWCNSKV